MEEGFLGSCIYPFPDWWTFRLLPILCYHIQCCITINTLWEFLRGPHTETQLLASKMWASAIFLESCILYSPSLWLPEEANLPPQPLEQTAGTARALPTPAACPPACPPLFWQINGDLRPWQAGHTPGQFQPVERSPQGWLGLWDVLARWAWEVLGWFIPGGRAGGQPPAPPPPFPHHASLGWSWGQMVGMGRPCSFWPDKGASVLLLRPDWCGWPSLTASHSQPWPALPWAAFLPRRSLPPSHLWGSCPSNVSEEPWTWKPTQHPPESEQVWPRQCCPVAMPGHRLKYTNKGCLGCSVG